MPSPFVPRLATGAIGERGIDLRFVGTVPVDQKKLSVAVCGATGYTGAELLRLLTLHPHVNVVCVTSQQAAGQLLTSRWPFLAGFYPLTLEVLQPESIAERADFVFMALPHTQAMAPADILLRAGKRGIDLSADFRLRSAALYQKWYKVPHVKPALLKQFVYGLTEIYRKQIAKAQWVANPGCYPTGALLPIYPYLIDGHIDETRTLIIDAKSGVSGAGRDPTAATHFPEVHDSIVAYSIGTHRHLPEIEQALSRKISVIFSPHLIPVNRGILSTIYLPLKRVLTQKRLESILDEAYAHTSFVRRVEGSPHLSSVRGSNFCDIGVFASGRHAILISAIDNLVKGASGQAIQNMNVMMGWPETCGLSAPGFFP